MSDQARPQPALPNPIVKPSDYARERELAAEAQKRAEEKRARLLDDFRAVLKTPQGRAVLWHLLEHSGVFQSNWVQSAQIHYTSGRQAEGHHLAGIIKRVDFQAWIAMQTEAHNEESKGAQ